MTNIALEDHTDTIRELNERLTLSPDSTAIVTIDMHHGHLDAREATQPVTVEDSERVRAVARELLEFARGQGISVVHVTLTWRPEEAYRFSPRIAMAKYMLSPNVPKTEARRRGDVHNLEGSVQCQLMPDIGPEPGDHWITNKKTYSIFLGTDLNLLLRTFLDVDSVVLMGINTNTCVLNAAFEACNQGYKAVVVSNACASSYGDDLHEFALSAIARTCGWVLTGEEVRQKLMEGDSE